MGVGVEQASVYNPWTDTWTAKTPMLAGRWYPSSRRQSARDLGQHFGLFPLEGYADLGHESLGESLAASRFVSLSAPTSQSGWSSLHGRAAGTIAISQCERPRGEPKWGAS